MNRRLPITTDAILSQLRSCLDAAAEHPGLVRSSVTQTEGYLRGLQGLPWETPAAVPPSPEDTAASFLHDVRKGAVALRGRVKKGTQDSLNAFSDGLVDAFPEAKGKPFLSALARLWVRWLADAPCEGDPAAHSYRNGMKIGERLKDEYAEGAAGGLAGFLLDRRIHLDGTRDFLRMRGWLLGVIEHSRRDPDPERRAEADILNANLSSILLRAQHNAGPDYAARVVASLSSITKNLDQAIRNLAATEPEAASYLRSNRNTVITRALHSGALDYADRVAHQLPRAIKNLDVPKKRSVVYRAITNGHLARLK